MAKGMRYFVVALFGLVGCSGKMQGPAGSGQQPPAKSFETTTAATSQGRAGKRILHCTMVNGPLADLIVDVFAIQEDTSKTSYRAITENTSWDAQSFGKKQTHIFDTLTQSESNSVDIFEAKDFSLKVGSQPVSVTEEDLPLTDFRYGRYSAEFRSNSVTREGQVQLVCNRIDDAERERWNKNWYCKGKIEPREEDRTKTSFGPVKMELGYPNREARIALDDLEPMNEKGWSLQINDSFLSTYLRLNRDTKNSFERFESSASYEANSISLHTISSAGSISVECRR